MKDKKLRKKDKRPFYKKYSYYEELYHINVVLCVGDLDRHMDFIGRRFNSTHDNVNRLAAFYASFEEEREDGLVNDVYVIFINEIDDFYSLSHELIHLCREALVNRGISVDLEKEDETFAYLHTHLLIKLWRQMGKWSDSKTVLHKGK